MEALNALDETGIHAGFVNGDGLYMTGILGGFVRGGGLHMTGILDGTDPRAT